MCDKLILTVFYRLFFHTYLSAFCVCVCFWRACRPLGRPQVLSCSLVLLGRWPCWAHSSSRASTQPKTNVCLRPNLRTHIVNNISPAMNIMISSMSSESCVKNAFYCNSVIDYSHNIMYVVSSCVMAAPFNKLVLLCSLICMLHSTKYRNARVNSCKGKKGIKGYKDLKSFVI